MGRKQTTPIDDRMHFRYCSLIITYNQEKLMHYQYKYMY